MNRPFKKFKNERGFDAYIDVNEIESFEVYGKGLLLHMKSNMHTEVILTDKEVQSIINDVTR